MSNAPLQFNHDSDKFNRDTTVSQSRNSNYHFEKQANHVPTGMKGMEGMGNIGDQCLVIRDWKSSPKHKGKHVGHWTLDALLSTLNPQL